MSSESENDDGFLKTSSASDDDDDDAVNLRSTSDSEPEPIYLKLKKKRNHHKNKELMCSMLTLPEHLAAYMEERELDRDIEPLECSEDTVEKIFNNYVIIKNILGHLSWQEKLISKDVCLLWNSAINRLQNEQLGPVDFSIKIHVERYMNKVQYKLLKSSEFYTEPMASFTFCNVVTMGAMYSILYEDTVPPPCSPVCDQLHCILDIIYQETTARRDCMFIVKAHTVSYLPLPQSITMENAIWKPKIHSDAFFGGIYIPKIPGVEFKVLSSSHSTQERLITKIKSLTEQYIVKGVVACLTDNYLLYVDQQNAECLQFLHEMQPGIPFAFGGCLVEDTVNTAQDLTYIVHCMNKRQDFISSNIMSVGLFLSQKDSSSPKSSPAAEEPKQNFEIYSFVMKSTMWNKSSIHQAVQEFSEQVPRFEHSVALKFSCIGRHHKHEMEQQSFRTFFPNTRLAGCFGNGELGVNHLKTTTRSPTATKRVREIIPYNKVHSNSTIFFYIGWGRVIEEAERDD